MWYFLKHKLTVTILMTGLLMGFAFQNQDRFGNEPLKYISREQAYKGKLVMQCSPDWNIINIDSLANNISILPGWGNYAWEITSASDSAGLYFQQGINMYYSFHIIEAMASFKKAQQFDGSNAMIWWSQALAYGPNINDVEETFTPDAYHAAQKAVSLSKDCTPREKALIRAMAVRYQPDNVIKRQILNQRYTDEMKNAFSQFPGDADIGALYADAIMVQHPWEYWKHNGDPHPWTPLLTEVLEKTLNIYPTHPGANHYYIHAVEASPDPRRALASANRLSELLPSVSHMVHMPSHIFIRSGYYQKGMKVNAMSVTGYNDYRSRFPAVENNAPIYLFHNLHMQAACAMFGAGYEESARIAMDCRNSFDTSYLSLAAPWGSYIQYLYMTPVINNVRFGKWQPIIDHPFLDSHHVYANVLLHWAKGIAYARQNNQSAARKELQLLKAKINKGDMNVIMQPFNAPSDAAAVAEKMLEGLIAEQAGDLQSAAIALKEAVFKEGRMIYNEPKDWILPVRPYLGAVLLKAGSFAEAEQVFLEDLKENPGNHWALKGLQEALLKQQKKPGKTPYQPEKSMAFEGMNDLPIVY